MNFLKALLFLVVATPLHAQVDTVRIVHTNYETVFSLEKRYPVLVEWWSTRDKVSCEAPVRRRDRFVPDPKLPVESNINQFYTRSGLDRGHIAPAADNLCLGENVMLESFFFTNMAPQYPGLNRGKWRILEEHTRDLAIQHDSIFVQAGCVGEERKLGPMSVPTQCWKILNIKATGEVIGYVFENNNERGTSFSEHMVPLDSIAKIRR
jgi:endonuclease G